MLVSGNSVWTCPFLPVWLAVFVDFRLLSRQKSITSIIVCEINVILFSKTFMTMMILKLFNKLNTLMWIFIVLLTNYDTCHNSRFWLAMYRNIYIYTLFNNISINFNFPYYSYIIHFLTEKLMLFHNFLYSWLILILQGRVKLYSDLNIYLNAMTKEMQNGQISKEIPLMFEKLILILNNSFDQITYRNRKKYWK